MKGYGQYCPIAKASEVVGERWAVLVLRELLIGSRRFNDIARGVPEMSRSLLAKRLRQFEEGALVERLDGEYHLTPAGEDLRGIVFAMGDWSAKWVLTDPAEEELDPEKLMWWAHSRLDTRPLPDRRVVIEFRFADSPRQFWVVAEPELGCSICMYDPGFGVDVVVETDVATLSRVWNDRETAAAAVAAGHISFIGQPALTRRMSTVLTIPPPIVMGASPAAPRPRLYEGR